MLTFSKHHHSQDTKGQTNFSIHVKKTNWRPRLCNKRHRRFELFLQGQDLIKYHNYNDSMPLFACMLFYYNCGLYPIFLVTLTKVSS